MANVEIVCPQCSSNTYQLTDAKTGEVMCSFCRSRWIVEELVQKTETERFLEEQAKQPKIVLDNSSKTDEQLMKAVSGLASGLFLQPLRALGTVLKRVIFALICIIVAVVVITVALTFFRIL